MTECASLSLDRSAYFRQYKDTHRQEISAKRRASYLVNRDRMLDQQRSHRQEVKAEVFKHYSQGQVVCAMCGESRSACLSIDHINGGGTQHLRKVGSGSAFYWWLRKHNYPEGFQVLCMNCQYVKRVMNNEAKGRARWV
jgi:hypothetical protein